MQSVLDQTHQDLELIIVADAPEDATLERVHGYDDKRIRVLVHKARRGGAAARNSGIEAARGSYVAFLDSDDIWLPQKLELQLRKMEEKRGPEWGGVYCGSIINMGGEAIKENRATSEGDLRYDLLSMSFELGGSSTLMLRRDCLAQLGGFDEAFHRHQDWELMVRFFSKYKLAAVEELLVVKNGFSLPEADDYVRTKQLFLDKFSEEIASYGKERSRRIMAVHWYDVAYLHFLQRKLVDSLQYLTKAWGWEPLPPPKRLWGMALRVTAFAFRIPPSRILMHF
jgi:glycosyltransferase involved in cell wall biosynthesis